MSKQALRFGIHDNTGHRSTTWKLWAEKGAGRSEVYLACRPLGGILKTSMHESGKWHIAYSQRAFEEYVKGAIPKFKDRYIEKWPRPSAFAPGITLAFRIVTPWSAVSTPVKEDKAKEITWLPNAPEQKATEIDILITKPTTQVIGWPGKQSMGTSFIGSFPLDNGQTVWAVYLIVDMPDFSSLRTGTGRFFKGKNKNDLKGEGLRLLVFDTKSDGSRVMYDCAVQIRQANEAIQPISVLQLP